MAYLVQHCRLQCFVIPYKRQYRYSSFTSTCQITLQPANPISNLPAEPHATTLFHHSIIHDCCLSAAKAIEKDREVGITNYLLSKQKAKEINQNIEFRELGCLRLKNHETSETLFKCSV